jgi:hypothetical protein
VDMLLSCFVLACFAHCRMAPCGGPVSRHYPNGGEDPSIERNGPLVLLNPLGDALRSLAAR